MKRFMLLGRIQWWHVCEFVVCWFLLIDAILAQGLVVNSVGVVWSGVLYTL